MCTAADCETLGFGHVPFTPCYFMLSLSAQLYVSLSPCVCVLSSFTKSISLLLVNLLAPLLPCFLRPDVTAFSTGSLPVGELTRNKATPGKD